MTMKETWSGGSGRYWTLASGGLRRATRPGGEQAQPPAPPSLGQLANAPDYRLGQTTPNVLPLADRPAGPFGDLLQDTVPVVPHVLWSVDRLWAKPEVEDQLTLLVGGGPVSLGRRGEWVASGRKAVPSGRGAVQA